ncbi:MAG TPA: hypothetical protein VFU04_05040 [Solirubrobacterales bacterium]|nr:hypothetical protein [Solirubrobacterales bacterium]
MREYKLTREEVAAMVVAENRSGADPRGNPFFVARIRGMQIRLVLALDDMSTVITLYHRER